MTDEFSLDKSKIRQSVKDQIRELVNSEDASIQIWKWVHDEENLSAVRAITEAWLVEQAKVAARYKVRTAERGAVTYERAPEPVYLSVEEKVAQILPAKVIEPDGLPSTEWLRSNEAFEFRRDHVQTYNQARNRRKTLDKNAAEDAKREESMKRINASFQRTMEEFKQSIRVEWTEELLGKTFTVDGVEVRWGQARADQHESRARWLKRHAFGTMETAALHEKAAELLRNKQARSLDEVEK